MLNQFNPLKVRLVEIPQVRKYSDSDSKEMMNWGRFTLNRKYKVLGLYSSETVTQFLVADDSGEFLWVDTGAFRLK